MAVNVPGHKGFINVQKEKQQENIQDKHTICKIFLRMKKLKGKKRHVQIKINKK